jgi:hypothetical protein
MIRGPDLRAESPLCGRPHAAEAVLPLGHDTTSGATRSHHIDPDPRRGTSSCQYRCRSRQPQRRASETACWRGRSMAGPSHYRSSTSSIREWNLWSIQPGCRLARLDAHEVDHLCPLFGFFGDELAEISRGAHHHCAAQVGKLCAELGVGEKVFS